MTSLTPNAWLLILFAVVPGFVANRAYALWCPTQKQDWEKALLEPITWSAVNLIFWWWLVVPVLQTPFDKINGVELSWVTFLVCVVWPTILARGWYWFRKSDWAHQTLRLDHPTPRGWDFFLHKCKNCFVLIHMKDGRMVGGYFGPESYASTFPQEPEIHLEQVWKINQTNGEFESPIVGSLGVVVRQADWDRIEFFEVPPQPEEVSESVRPEQEDRCAGSESDGRAAGDIQGRGAREENHNGDEEADSGTEGRDWHTPEASPAEEVVVPPQPEEVSESVRPVQEDCRQRCAGEVGDGRVTGQSQSRRAGGGETDNGKRQADGGTEGRNGNATQAATTQKLGATDGEDAGRQADDL